MKVSVIIIVLLYKRCTLFGEMSRLKYALDLLVWQSAWWPHDVLKEVIIKLCLLPWMSACLLLTCTSTSVSWCISDSTSACNVMTQAPRTRVATATSSSSNACSFWRVSYRQSCPSSSHSPSTRHCSPSPNYVSHLPKLRQSFTQTTSVIYLLYWYKCMSKIEWLVSSQACSDFML